MTFRARHLSCLLVILLTVCLSATACSSREGSSGSPAPAREAATTTGPGASPGEAVAAEKTPSRDTVAPAAGAQGLDARSAQAAQSYDAGKTADAERAWTAILKENPAHVGALVGLAQIRLDRDDLDGASEAIERALKANPQSVPAIKTKVAVLLARDKTQEAVTLARSSLKIDPKSPALQQALGDAERAFGDDPKAIEAYRRVVGLNPGGAVGWTKLGEALAANGDAREAQTTLLHALELNPESYAGYRALARLQYDEGHPDQAADAWSHAVRLQPARGEAHEGLAEALLASKKTSEARREAEEARRLGRNVDALLAKINAAAK
ncbi:MAG TPA: tetratricopeptide repeat protein [Verrucomicrobiae bacterium]|nr:tetratricopeptide repeat protein [Verrucomicrobiae bacterium]